MKKEDCIRKGLPTEDEDYNNLEYNPVDGEAIDATGKDRSTMTGRVQIYYIKNN